MTPPTIFVVTPAYNSADHIDRAIMAVVSQSGPFNIRYHIQDGLSDDGTVERIKWWKNAIETQSFPISCEGLELTYESAEDSGMYDALARAFNMFDLPDDAFATWINADDLVAPGAFAVLAKVATTHSEQDVAWVTGRRSYISDEGVPREHLWPDALPSREAIAAGLCDCLHIWSIQQEGTAFRGWLWRAAQDAGLFDDCKLAGDWLLWTKMAQHANLHQLPISLGLFHVREGQLSGDMDGYFAEIERFVPTKARDQALCALLSSEEARNHKLEFDEQSGTFVAKSDSINRYAIASHAIVHKPELVDRIEEIVPEVSMVRRALSSLSDVEILDLTKQFSGYSQLWPLLSLSEEIESRYLPLAARQKRFDRLADPYVHSLVERADLDKQDWKRVAKRHPWKVGLWRAVKRYQQSSPDA